MYVVEEIKKLLKSRIQLLASLTCIPMILLYLFTVQREPDISSYKFFMRNWSELDILFLHIPTIIATGLLFSKEFQDRTMMYVFIRPINHTKLFFSKVIAIFVYSSAVISSYCIVLFLISIIFLKNKPLDFDLMLHHTMIRAGILFLYTFIGILLVCTLCCFISMFVRNMFGCSIISCILWVILSSLIAIPIKFDEVQLLVEGKLAVKAMQHINMIQVSTYKSPAYYYQLEINSFIQMFFKIVIINLSVISIFFGINIYIFSRIRSGKKAI